LRSGWVVALFVLVVVGTYLALSTLAVKVGLLHAAIARLDDPQLAVGGVIGLVSALVGTVVVAPAAREPWWTAGFRDPSAGRHLAEGAAIGLGLVAVVVVVPWLAGREGIGGPTAGWRALLAAGALQLAFCVPQSAAEEVLLRGVPLVQLARGLGPAVSI